MYTLKEVLELVNKIFIVNYIREEVIFVRVGFRDQL